jgi:hypothetical protein
MNNPTFIFKFENVKWFCPNFAVSKDGLSFKKRGIKKNFIGL